MKRLSLLMLCLLVLPALAAPRYAITDLGTVGNPSCGAVAVNNQGQVAGTFVTEKFHPPLSDSFSKTSIFHAFLWQNGKMQDLGAVKPDADSRAYGINNRGQVVGSCGDDAVIWQDGTMHILSSIPDGNSYWENVASAINDAGQIAGASHYHACLWQNGKPVDLGSLGGGRAVATAINKRGEIIGHSWMLSKRSGDPPPIGPTHAFLWSAGKMQDLGASLPYEDESYADCIADDGTVYGVVQGPLFSSPKPPFLTAWRDGEAIQVGTFTRICACNRLSDLVGRSGSTVSVRLHGQIYDLNHSLSANSGWVLGTVTAINDKGWIVGNGERNGEARTFLLTPQ